VSTLCRVVIIRKGVQSDQCRTGPRLFLRYLYVQVQPGFSFQFKRHLRLALLVKKSTFSHLDIPELDGGKGVFGVTVIRTGWGFSDTRRNNENGTLLLS